MPLPGVQCPFVNCRCILGVTFDKAQFSGMEKVIVKICVIWYVLRTKRLIVSQASPGLRRYLCILIEDHCWFSRQASLLKWSPFASRERAVLMRARLQGCMLTACVALESRPCLALPFLLKWFHWFEFLMSC